MTVKYLVDEKGNKIPRLQQGDTIRGSLHQDSIYGAIYYHATVDHHIYKEMKGYFRI